MKVNVKEIREKLKISQQDLANSCGVSRQTIYSLEVKKYCPSVLLVLKISKQLNCEINDLFELENDD